MKETKIQDPPTKSHGPLSYLVVHISFWGTLRIAFFGMGSLASFQRTLVAGLAASIRTPGAHGLSRLFAVLAVFLFIYQHIHGFLVFVSGLVLDGLDGVFVDRIPGEVVVSDCGERKPHSRGRVVG